MLGIHQQTLRYYEREGLIGPSRSRGNIRLYSLSDINRLRQVQRLINDLGVNLAGAAVILRDERTHASNGSGTGAVAGATAPARPSRSGRSRPILKCAARTRRTHNNSRPCRLSGSGPASTVRWTQHKTGKTKMMRQDRFTEQAQEVLAASQEMVRQQRHTPVGRRARAAGAGFSTRAAWPSEFSSGWACLCTGTARAAARQRLEQSPKLAPSTSRRSYARRASCAMLETADAEAEPAEGRIHRRRAPADRASPTSATARRPASCREYNIDKERIYRALHEVRGKRACDRPARREPLPGAGASTAPTSPSSRGRASSTR